MANQSLTAISEVSKLSGSANYSVWKFRMRSLLQKEDLWHLVNPYEEHDVVVDDNVGVAARDTPRLRFCAMAVINLLVKEPVIPYIAELTELEEVWRTLKNLFESQGNARRLLLKSRLHALQLEEGGSVFDMLKEVREITNQLAAIGECISDEDIIENILNSLLESYEGFVSSITYRENAPSFVEFTSLLLHDEVCHELSNN